MEVLCKVQNTNSFDPVNTNGRNIGWYNLKKM